MPQKALKNVGSKFNLTAQQVEGIFGLLDQGYSIPYVLRYHKELSAGLTVGDMFDLIEEEKRLDKLENRRRKIINKLDERDMLTEDLRERLEQAQDMRELIDYYVPFRPRKRSRSRQALALGLNDLAARIFTQEEFIADLGEAASEFVDEDTAGLETPQAVLEGVFAIIVDWIAEEKSHRDRQRKVFAEQADVVAQKAGKSVPGRYVRDFRQYFDFREKVSDLHPFHMLKILRGKRLRVIQYRVEPPMGAMGEAAAELYLPGGGSQYNQLLPVLTPGALEGNGEDLMKLNSSEFMGACIKHSLETILGGITARELDKELCRNAEQLALEVIRRNVRDLLMAKPLQKNILGIHPGYRTGCNLAVTDAEGNVLTTGTVYPHQPMRQVSQSKEDLSSLIEEHDIEVVVIGDATGTQETEKLISELIAEKFPDLRYTVVSEVGIEAYAESRAARNEMEDVDERERYAVALCRRVNDPLYELVKINPRELCPEPYCDDVNSGALKKLLDDIIEECICEVGVDVNRANVNVLRYVSGVGPDRANELVGYREKNGPFKTREEIRRVPKMDEVAWNQSVGFLRVSGSTNPLDLTRIHPQFYPIASAICQQMEIKVPDLATDEGRAAVEEQRSQVKLAELEKEFDVHYLLLKEIIDEMAHPWADPRENREGPVLRQERLTLATLEPENWYMGTVRNIVDFGVFVDVGVGEDGLVHISELSDQYVESPYDIVSVGDRVRVRVVRVEEDRGRIALSMREESPQRKPRRDRPPRKRRSQRSDSRERSGSRSSGGGSDRSSGGGKGAGIPSDRAEAAVSAASHGPKSTRGMDSRRVQRASLAEHIARNQNRPVSVSSGSGEGKASDQPREGEGTGEEQEGKLGGLLGKLDFANIERRGEGREDE
jgi:uncharacterized protein